MDTLISILGYAVIGWVVVLICLAVANATLDETNIYMLIVAVAAWPFIVAMAGLTAFLYGIISVIEQIEKRSEK